MQPDETRGLLSSDDASEIMAELGCELGTLISRQRNERLTATPREIRAIVELASAMVEIGGESARVAFVRALRSRL